MASEELQPVVRHLRRLAGSAGEGGLSDPELLARWLDRRDEAAFEVLLWRHGPMVLGVCRRVLRHAGDAEDAFQATFLILARKAATIGRREALAGWLYRVAHRVALHARARGSKRPATMPLGLAEQVVAQPEDPTSSDLRPVLDEEIARLPEKYRLPVVLCYLEGETTDEAARQLGWPRGTVATRLAAARERLRARLAHRGVTLAVALAPPALSRSAVQSAVAHAGGSIPARVAALADGALRPLLLARLRTVAVLLLATGLLAAGAGLAGWHAPAEGQPVAAEPQPPPRRDLDGIRLPAGVLARMGSGRLRHTGRIRDLAFTPDGKSLAIGGDFNLHLWDLATGRLRRRFGLSSGWSLDLAFSADGSTLTALDGENSLICRRFDLGTGRPLSQFPMTDDRTAFLSPRGERMAVVARDGKAIRLHDTVHGKEILRIPFREGRIDVAFAPGAGSLALADGSDTVRLLDTSNGKKIAELKRPGATIRRVVFSPDGRSLASIRGGGREGGDPLGPGHAEGTPSAARRAPGRSPRLLLGG
jgi:RNA polymerase sigma factor (sigma-70 family)